MEALEYIALAMNLAGVDLIEERHHDEGVEDDGEVLGRRGVELGFSARVNVQQCIT